VKIALIDNGSLESAAHEGLRAAARAIGGLVPADVEAVSWKHSSRIDAAALRGGAAATLVPWVRAQLAAGEREFVFVPFFISPQGAIGSALRADLEALRAEAGPFEYSFAEGLGDGAALGTIVADRVRETAAALGLQRLAVVVVDHGGPSRTSADVRNRVTDAVRSALGETAASVTAASMESPVGPGFEFNRPLLAAALAVQGHGDVVIAPLFLLPGRHAGPGGDLETIVRAAESLTPGLHCHFTALVGSHPAAIEALASSLARALPAVIHS
jgi:sirohydrochlorin ferrochelatase